MKNILLSNDFILFHKNMYLQNKELGCIDKIFRKILIDKKNVAK
jgi:hypothetical protein